MTNIHVNKVSLEIKANGNRIERASNCKYLDVIVDEKVSREENC